MPSTEQVLNGQPHAVSDAGPAAATRPKRRGKRGSAKRGRGRPHKARGFPAATFEESLPLAQAIQQYAAGQKVRRLTIFDKLGKSPESGPSRQLVSNSSKYGLTVGAYQAEHLELTEDGRSATSPEAPPRERLTGRFRLAIENISPFKRLYEQYKGGKLPSQQVMRDFLMDSGLPEEEVAECVDTFILNAKFIGILRTVAGAERLLSIEHLLEEQTSVPITSSTKANEHARDSAGTPTELNWSKICFYIAPIGDERSELRQHSDLLLSALIEPAVEQFGLKVVRADQIGKPGMITGQVVEHIVRSRLVVADLSFHNPNVFYELSLRHACRLPTVQVIRACDTIPFDLEQFRTIKIDTTSIYSLVPKLDTHRAEIANQVRRALSNPDEVDNPITTFLPELKVAMPDGGGV